MDVIIAARLSQEDDGQTGIDTQDQDSRAFCDEQGFNIVDIVPDHKTGSGDWTSRPNLRPWLEEPEKLVRYRGIVAATQDRLSRGRWRDEIAIRLWAEDNHKEIWIVDTGLHWPPRNMMEQRAWDMGATSAREEWEKTSRRYRRAQKWLRDNEFLVGRPPFGYRVAGVLCGNSPCSCKKRKGEPNDHMKLVPDEETAPYVVAMAERAIEGQTLVRIAEWLNSEGIAPPQNGSWTTKSVSQILRNPTINGRRKEYVKVENPETGRPALKPGKTILRCEPILDRATWDKVQAALDGRTSHHLESLSPNTAMLTNIAVCAKCGGPMYKKNCGRWNADGTRKDYFYYRCHGTAEHPSTCKNLIPVKALNDWVHEQITGPEYGTEKMVIVTVITGPDYQDEIDAVENRLDALDYDDPDYDRQHRELIAARKRLIGLRDHEDAKPALLRQETSETVAEYWTRLNEAERRDFLLRRSAKVKAAGKRSDGWELDVDEINVLTN